MGKMIVYKICLTIIFPISNLRDQGLHLPKSYYLVCKA
nr:MAG TPA: hypothetical protein [Crassvirales sp.]